jgi:hypothetical protein
MDCATCIDPGEEDARPKPGDLTICIKCGEFLIFGKGYKLRLPTRDEYRKYGNEPRIIKAQILVRGSADKSDHLK